MSKYKLFNISVEEDQVETTDKVTEVDTEEVVEVVNDQNELDHMVESTEEAFEVQEDLQEQVIKNEETLNNTEPVEETDIQASQESFAYAVGRLRLPKEYIKDNTFGFESSTNNNERLKISTEGIKEFLVKIWEGIKKMFKKIGDFFKMLWLRIKAIFSDEAKMLLEVEKGLRELEKDKSLDDVQEQAYQTACEEVNHPIQKYDEVFGGVDKAQDYYEDVSTAKNVNDLKKANQKVKNNPLKDQVEDKNIEEVIITKVNDDSIEGVVLKMAQDMQDTVTNLKQAQATIKASEEKGKKSAAETAKAMQKLRDFQKKMDKSKAAKAIEEDAKNIEKLEKETKNNPSLEEYISESSIRSAQYFYRTKLSVIGGLNKVHSDVLKSIRAAKKLNNLINTYSRPTVN